MPRKKKSKAKKKPKPTSWFPAFKAESLNEFYAFALIIIIFVTFYQFYSFSSEAYDMFVHPAFNWTCSNVNAIDQRFSEKCDEVKSYVPGEVMYDYDYNTFKEDFDYGEIEEVPVDENALVRFAPRPNRTSQEVYLSQKAYVKKTFEKYLSDAGYDGPIKTKFKPEPEAMENVPVNEQKKEEVENLPVNKDPVIRNPDSEPVLG